MSKAGLCGAPKERRTRTITGTQHIRKNRPDRCASIRAGRCRWITSGAQQVRLTGICPCLIVCARGLVWWVSLLGCDCHPHHTPQTRSLSPTLSGPRPGTLTRPTCLCDGAGAAPDQHGHAAAGLQLRAVREQQQQLDQAQREGAGAGREQACGDRRSTGEVFGVHPEGELGAACLV